jgi:hypothetical protein
MNPEFKYLIFKMDPDRADGKEVAVVFPKELSHKQVSRIHRAGDVAFMSAGFCTWWSKESKWSVHGRSETLNVTARPEDAAILLSSFPLHQE